MQDKKYSTMISSTEGDAFWQPGAVKGNCITIKISPWNAPNTKHTVFLHELPKDGEVREHAHEHEEEIFTCLEGEGVFIIDGKEFSFKPHDVAYIAPQSKHSIRAISHIPLKFMVVISPTGLEERLKLMGIARKTLDETQPEPFSSAIGKNKSHGVI